MNNILVEMVVDGRQATRIRVDCDCTSTPAFVDGIRTRQIYVPECLECYDRKVVPIFEEIKVG